MSKLADFWYRLARLKCRCPVEISQRDLHGSFRFVYVIFILQLSLIVPLSVAVALSEQTFQVLLEGFHMVLSLSSIVAMVLLHVALKYERLDFKRDQLQSKKENNVPQPPVHKSASETKEPETGQIRRTNISDHHLPTPSSSDSLNRPTSFNPPVILENDLSTIREESPSPSPATPKSPPTSSPFDDHSSPTTVLLHNSPLSSGDGDRAAHEDHKPPHDTGAAAIPVAHEESTLHVPGQQSPGHIRVSTASSASQAVGVAMRRTSAVGGSRLSLAAQSAVSRTRKITMQMVEYSQQAIRSVVPDENGEVAVLKAHNKFQVPLSGADLCMRFGALGTHATLLNSNVLPYL